MTARPRVAAVGPPRPWAWCTPGRHASKYLLTPRGPGSISAGRGSPITSGGNGRRHQSGGESTGRAPDEGAGDAGPPAAPDTADRILAAFLRLAAARGLDATTTRAVAAEAGVNEVTLFRRFGDQATMAREAVRRFSPAGDIARLDPAIDASSPAAATAGLLRCLRALRAGIRAQPETLLFGFGESHRFPDLREAVMATPRAVHGLLRRALAQAAPALRPEVDTEATAFQWMGLLTLPELLAARGAIPPPADADWDRMLAAAVAQVVRA